MQSRKNADNKADSIVNGAAARRVAAVMGQCEC